MAKTQWSLLIKPGLMAHLFHAFRKEALKLLQREN
jgi:hypothetical protein